MSLPTIWMNVQLTQCSHKATSFSPYFGPFLRKKLLQFGSFVALNLDFIVANDCGTCCKSAIKQDHISTQAYGVSIHLFAQTLTRTTFVLASVPRLRPCTSSCRFQKMIRNQWLDKPYVARPMMEVICFRLPRFESESVMEGLTGSAFPFLFFSAEIKQKTKNEWK